MRDLDEDSLQLSKGLLTAGIYSPKGKCRLKKNLFIKTFRCENL